MSIENSMIRIVFVEDNEHDRLAFKRAFQKGGASFEITEFSRGEDALEALESKSDEYDIVVFDHDLPGASGLEFCKRLIADHFPLPIVILTGNGTEQLAVEALKAGVDDYLVKDTTQGYLTLLPVVLRDVVKRHGERVARRRAEEAFAQSEKRYHALFEAAGDAILIHGMDGRILDVNQTACDRLLFSREELLTKGCHDIEAPEFAHSIPERMKEFHQTGYLIFETAHLRRDGSPIPIEISCRRIDYEGLPAILCIARDITERKRLEAEKQELQEQMEHAQKIQSLGTMAGGIAHSYNNLLQGIIGNLEFALEEVSTQSPLEEFLRNAMKAADKGSIIARQMLAYSGKGRVFVSQVNLSAIFNEISHLVHASIPERIILDCQLTEELPSIQADTSQIQQLIMNLVVNAMEAIGENSGRIVIKTGLVKCSRDELKHTYLPNHLSAGWYVFLELSDTGCGMDDETKDKMFDPFFTKHITGRGLGLAAVLGIVRGHKGTIKVDSQPGKGTTFQVMFPV